MPLENLEYGDFETRIFFENLVPEGSLFAGMCRLTKIDASDKFRFLEKWGRECAGALQFSAGNGRAWQAEGGLVPLSVASWFTSSSRTPLAWWLPAGCGAEISSLSPRLSLAGGQDKLPVVWKDGRLWYPAGGTPSTHILKPDTEGFPHSARTEVFCLGLVASLGLAAARAFLLPVKRGAFAVVERYDREGGRRLHQIDFCQAMGLRSYEKYQESGSRFTGIRSIAECCSACCASAPGKIPAAEHLALAMIFNYLIMNTDAHAKNFSLIYRSAGDVSRHLELAPLYNLNSMLIYNTNHAKICVTYGGELKYHKICGIHFSKIAKELNLNQDFMTR